MSDPLEHGCRWQVLSKEDALRKLLEHRRLLLSQDQRCVMCALARGAANPPAIAESDHGVVLLDRFACRYGHLLVVGKMHVETVAELSWLVFSDLQRLVFRAARALDRTLRPARIFTATLGAASELPMTYAHYHVHLIPVVETDERARPARVLSWTEGVTVYSDAEALELSSRLSQAWPQIDEP